MWKSTLKAIEKNDLKKSFIEKLNSSSNSIKQRKPHFIFSAENPRYPEQNKLKMNHGEMLEFLKDRGYKAEAMTGKYGDRENSIVVHNPPKHSIDHLLRLSSKSGQESSLYSDGYNHELHYHHGENAGKHHKGQGTHHHKKEPKDNYSRTQDGTFFTHSLDFSEAHGPDKSMINRKPDDMINKSESMLSRPILIKNEEESHPLETAGSDTKLIHYSPKSGLKELSPEHHGATGVGSEAKQGQPKHPMSFLYLEGTKPEDAVTSGAKSKYVAEKGNMKFYDVGKDPHKLRDRAKAIAEKENLTSKYPNPPGSPVAVGNEHLHQAVKNAGFHGIYNSSQNETMRNVVGVFGKVPISSEHKIHPNDFKETSSLDHYGDNLQRKNARSFAKENQHHDGSFLHRLTNALKDKK